jgi:hypothetical protein
MDVLCITIDFLSENKHTIDRPILDSPNSQSATLIDADSLFDKVKVCNFRCLVINYDFSNSLTIPIQLNIITSQYFQIENCLMCAFLSPLVLEQLAKYVIQYSLFSTW